MSQLVGQLAGLWQDQRPTSYTTCWALVLPEPKKFVGDVAQQVGQLVRIMEFGQYPLDKLLLWGPPWTSRVDRGAETSNTEGARHPTIRDAHSAGFVAEPRPQTLYALKNKNWPYLKQQMKHLTAKITQ
jgi:hypothetical protein